MYRFLNGSIIFLELPADTPLLDLDKTAGIDLSSLPRPEKKGEEIIKEITEWMLTETSSSESGIMPQDKIKRLLVGVSQNLFSFLQS